MIIKSILPWSSLLFILLLTSCNINNYMSDPEPSRIKSQGNLPDKPAPGKCYIRCVTPESYETHEETYPVYAGGEIAPDELDTLTLVLKPHMARWEYKSSMENCRSNDPRDCMVLCYIEYPEETKEIIIVNDEEKTDLYKYQTFTFQDVYDKGGVAVWEEIDCKLTDYNNLPILFNKNVAALEEADKNIINKQLLALLKEKPNIRMEITSHTDARGEAKSNRELSQKRAEAVVEHLIAEGIQRSRFLAKGYGEERLKNNCRDGVDCTEDEHAENERTEFRVLSN